MATSVMSANNSATNNSTINNGNLVKYPSSTTTPSYMPTPPLNTNNPYSMQIPYLEQGMIDQSCLSNPFPKQSYEIYPNRHQTMFSTQQQHSKYLNQSYYEHAPQHQQSTMQSQLQSLQQTSQPPHVNHYNVDNNNNQYPSSSNSSFQHQFFSPEHVDGMVSILKGEDDFMNHLLDNSVEPLTTFDIEDHHSFNPTIVSQRTKKVVDESDDFDHVTEDEEDRQQERMKSPSNSSNASSGHGNMATKTGGSDNGTRTSSPTNSQEKNSSSPYPNGRKRASKACVECQKRHTRCGFERPCERCVRLGLECVEMKSNKKRGRSTMGSNQDNDVAPTTDKNGQSGSKKKVNSKSAETKKRKASPITNPTEQSEVKPSKISKADNVNTNPSIITTLTSTSATNHAMTRSDIPPNTSHAPMLDNSQFEKPLGVIAVGPDFTSVQYVSDPLSNMFPEQPLLQLESIMGQEFIQHQLNLLCEAKATRETIISHVDNGLVVLQQSHLRAERTARAMIKLKDGKLAEMSIKFVFMYNPANPSILDSAYIFLNWNGSYIVNNHHY